MPLRRNQGSSKRNSSGDPEEFRASLVEHLDELRTRIIRILALIVIGWVIGWYMQPWLYDALQKVARANMQMPKGTEYKDVFSNFSAPFMLKLKLSFFIGVILTFPFTLLQLWGFVEPGLKANEKKPIKVVAPLSVFLFALGVFFCWIILPAAFSWFVSYMEEFPGTSLFQEAGTLVFFILKMFLAFGVGFQLPLIVYFLAKIGILGPDTLTKYWRQSTVAIFFGAAALTPSNDLFSMLMMAVPLTILFFISLFAIQVTSRKKKNEGEDEALSANDELDELD